MLCNTVHYLPNSKFYFGTSKCSYFFLTHFLTTYKQLYINHLSSKICMLFYVTEFTVISTDICSIMSK